MKERPEWVEKAISISRGMVAAQTKTEHRFGFDAVVWLTDALAEVEKERNALAGILSVVETQEHNRAVLEWGGNVLDYAHAMENGGPQ
jgi:hypothetical protein